MNRGKYVTSRTIEPLTNSTHSLGSPNYKWLEVYAGKFYGNLQGNADSAGNADTLDGYHATSFGKVAKLELTAGNILRIDMIGRRGLLINIQGTNGDRNALYFVTGY